MKIVEIVNTLEVGGTERLVVDLSSALQARGHELTVVCLRTSGALSPALDRAGIEIVALGKSDGPSLPTVGRLKRLLRQKQIDAVHTHNPLVHHYGVVGGRLAGVPAVVNTIHGIANISEKIGPKEALYSLSCRLSDSVVAVCAMAYRTFARGKVIPRAKLVTINNGIPLEPFLTIPPRDSDGTFVFGIVGRLVPVKDHKTLLEAFAELSRSFPAARLEVLGDGPLRETLERQAAERGIADKVRFHGYSNDVAGFLRRIDTFVLCSVSEGLPLGVLEAMAAGRPVVGTTVGGLPDLIQDGQCGWTCPPSSPSELAAAMRKAMATPAEERVQMGLRGREHAATNYSLAQMAEGHEALFERIVAEKHGTRS